jgi:MSHA biogenesis protein MshI
MRILPIGFHPIYGQSHVSIGVSPSHICLMNLWREANHITVTALDKVAYEPPQLTNVLHDLAKKWAFCTESPCVLVMPVSTYQLVRLEIPRDLDTAGVSELVTEQLQAKLSFDLSHVIFDFFEPPDFLNSHYSRWIYVVVTEKALIQSYTRPIVAAGFNLQAVDIPEMALRNLLALSPLYSENQGILWLDQQHSVLILTHKQMICSIEFIALGQQQLLQELNTSQKALNDLIWALERAICQYMQHFNLPRISQLMIAPALEELSILPRYLSAALNVPTQRLILDELLQGMNLSFSFPSANCLFTLGAALREIESDDV